MIHLFYGLIALAILLMLMGLIMALRLRRIATGGVIGKVVKMLIGLIVLFTFGYFAAPLLHYLSTDTLLVLVGVIFFFGAVYVVLVLWIIGRLVKQVQEELEN